MNEEDGFYPRFKKGRRAIRRYSNLELLFGDRSVTFWLIFINILFFFLSFIFIYFGADIENLALNSAAFMQRGTVWTLLTSMFMHGGLFHLLINMFVLLSLGGLCEKIIGRIRFLWFYLIAGLFAGLLHVFFSYFFGNSKLGAAIFGSPLISAVGASGAIFAIAGLFVVLTPKLRFYILFLPFFSLPAYIMVPLVLILTWFASSSYVFFSGAAGGIGNVAHFGGFLVGLLYGFYLRRRYRKKTKIISQLFSE